MGLLNAMFGRSRGPRAAELAVSAIERIRDLNRGGLKIDAKKLPMERDALKRLLLNEIEQLKTTRHGLPTATRYAECYVAIAFFQPGADAVGEEYRQVFAAPLLDLNRLLRINDGVDVWSEKDRYVAELQRAGHGDLVAPDIFDPNLDWT